MAKEKKVYTEEDKILDRAITKYELSLDIFHLLNSMGLSEEKIIKIQDFIVEHKPRR